MSVVRGPENNGLECVSDEDDDPDREQRRLMAKLRRICMPKGNSGVLEVSMDIHKKFKDGGRGRTELLEMLKEVNGDKDSLYDLILCTTCMCMFTCDMSHFAEDQFLTKLTILRIKEKQNKCSTRAGFYTREQMKTELQYSQFMA